MSILIDQNTRMIIQGITGREAMIRAKLMLDYGSRLVGGVTPGKRGQQAHGLPVFDTVEEAVEQFPDVTLSVIFVPGSIAKDAVFEAIDAGIKLVVVMPERMPQQDMLEVIAYARENNVFVIGPNTLGLISPGKALAGMIGARVDFANQFFVPGPVGVISRSGGNTTTVCYYLTKAGMGQSTAISIGGDAFVGSTMRDLLPLFEQDPETKVVVLYGEIGTTIEEDAAELIAEGKFTKPLIAYVAGKYVTQGMRFGHGGAIISRGQGTAEGKIKALESVGAICVDHFSDIGNAAKRALNIDRIKELAEKGVI